MKRRKLRHNQNPYLSAVEREMKDCECSLGFACRYCRGSRRRIGNRLRDDMVLEYAWAIPNEEAIQCLVSVSPIVEMGAGTGYWAALVKDRGGSIDAYDLVPDEQRVLWTDVVAGTPEALRSSPRSATGLGDHCLYTLLLCWPDDITAASVEAWDGNRLVYVGEPAGGCTDAPRLGKGWKKTKTIEIPQWTGCHDRMVVYEREIRMWRRYLPSRMHPAKGEQ